LYWFVPDGLRADEQEFKLYEWARAGKLPNIQKLMKSGSYGYSSPVFPGHSAINFAALMTGSSALKHGVSDDSIRLNANAINGPAINGYNSFAKKTPSAWNIFEEHNLSSSLLSVPGSTPVDFLNGVVLNGRFGDWGIPVSSILFNSFPGANTQLDEVVNRRLGLMGFPLTKFTDSYQSSNWNITLPESFSAPREVLLENMNSKMYALIIDSTDDKMENYDQAIFSFDRKNTIARLSVGEWSDWLPVIVSTDKGESGFKLNTQVKIALIKLGQKDFFRIRFVYNHLNQSLIYPDYLFDNIHKNLGPMTDYPDTYPPQLVYFAEDKKIFLDEAHESFKWHQKAVPYLINKINNNVIIHTIYTPNQMLVSRWWMGYMDHRSPEFQLTDKVATTARSEVLKMYQQVDKMVGEILNNSSKNTCIVLSSDHGIAPLNKEVLLNNLFIQKKWLKVIKDKKNNLYNIDWKNSKVVYLKTNHVYINPENLVAPKNKSPKYFSLRNEVRSALMELKDEKKNSPIDKIINNEETGASLHLPSDRSGDLVIVNKAGYSWSEETNPTRDIFKNSLRSGYKQALDVSDYSMQTPFIIKCAGIRQNHQLKQRISHLDQLPTILKALKIKSSNRFDGKILNEIFE
jgi:predicted AlkP superfamily phosphohydrolase/phosphomutase